jgi:catecholate siderophore receptor
VDGIALGIAGQLTHDWSIFANATFLDSEVLQGVSDACVANPSARLWQLHCRADPLSGRPSAARPSARPASGPRTISSAGRSATAPATRAATLLLPALGANAGDIKGYTTHRAMVAFDVNDQLSLQLNASNLFDKVYYIRARNNGWATPGDARSWC